MSADDIDAASLPEIAVRPATIAVRPATIAVRPATIADRDVVTALLASLDLDYPGRDLARCHVGEIAGAVVAVAELRPLGRALLLGCVGVRADHQARGIGRRFVTALLDGIDSDVYLFTVAPDFFRHLGFVVSEAPRGLVRSAIYGCRDCTPERCVCLVRRADATVARTV